MRSEEALRRIATQALDATKADEAEVVLSANESALTRFANSTIHQNVFEASVEVRVRAVLGTRIGVATTTRTDERSLRETAERAVESARYVPENPEFQGLPAPGPITPVSAHSSATASYSAERRARDVKGVCDEASGHGLNASGRAPRAWTPDSFSHHAAMPFKGWDSVTVPGVVSGWRATWERFGTLPFDVSPEKT